MNPINSRIALIVQQSGLNKTAFAKKLNISQSMVSFICSGKTGVSDRTIADICRVFNIREEWLRDGSGEMHRQATRSDELSAVVQSLSGSSQEKSRLVSAFASLPDEAYPVLTEYIQQICKALSED